MKLTSKFLITGMNVIEPFFCWNTSQSEFDLITGWLHFTFREDYDKPIQALSLSLSFVFKVLFMLEAVLIPIYHNGWILSDKATSIGGEWHVCVYTHKPTNMQSEYLQLVSSDDINSRDNSITKLFQQLRGL